MSLWQNVKLKRRYKSIAVCVLENDEWVEKGERFRFGSKWEERKAENKAIELMEKYVVEMGGSAITV